MLLSPRADDPLLIVISGLPASGKTTLGRELGRSLGLPVFDKDDYLEALFGLGSVSAEERSRLSRAADDQLCDAVVSAASAIVVSFWRHRTIATTSGTPTEWLSSFDDVVEVWCACAPATARDRFLARRRHPGHGDAVKEPAEVLATFERLHALGPLEVGRVVEVRTDRPVDIEDLVRRIRAV